VAEIAAMIPWVIVAGDFVRTGGMDHANHALADHLARRGGEVHLVAHRVDPDLAARAGVAVHHVPRPLGSHLLGFPLLDRAGRRTVRELDGRRPVAVANGGNCAAGDVVWLHYVHAAYAPEVATGAARRVMHAAARRRFLRDERAAVRRARVVFANSELTARDAVERLGASSARVHVVYYGAGPHFRPPSPAERAEAQRALGWTDERPAVAFVGALGDRRKGFDTVLAAWSRLTEEGGWDARLAVAGAGAEAEMWRRRAEAAGLGDSVVFLGFQADVRLLLWAADALVSPTRYEAYGLAVQEAVCCGLPALVSRSAGVAERIGRDAAALLLPDPDDAADLARRLRAWRAEPDAHHAAALDLSARLCAWSWDDMAARMVDIALEGR
jgi:glycosyltransferase involved in cell wall biosynthesis